MIKTKDPMAIPRYEINESYSQRLSALRVISIIFVVYIHSYSDEVRFTDSIMVMNTSPFIDLIMRSVSLTICAAAVPILFLVSGILLYRQEISWASNIYKKAKTLVFPYVFWNLLWILLFFCMQSLSISQPFFSNGDKLVRNFGLKEWINAFWGFYQPDAFFYPFYYPFWFLKDLIFLNVFAVLIKKAIDRAPFVYIAVILTLWLCDVCIYIVNPEALLFFSVGYYIVKRRIDIEAIDQIHYGELTACYVLSIACDQLFGEQLIILHKLSIVIGILFFTRLSLTIIKTRFLNKTLKSISELTFIIFAFHEYNLRIVKKLATKFLPQTSTILLFEYILFPVAIIALCICIGIICKKTVPKFYSAITGGRM